jgi:hypothetical protein
LKLEEIQLAKKHAYIKENYEKWNFLEAFSASDDYKTEPIDFYFEFKKSSTCSLAELVKKEHRYICNDGYIKEHSIDDLSECIVVHNRKQALKIFANINRIFDDYLSKAGLEGIEYYRQYFEISVRRDGMPKHLFTKDEIEALMRNADDRNNNGLVIDENGYARIISDEENTSLYPVHIETWGAGNNYVGKYSKLYALEESYKFCLYGWYWYLVTREVQYVDFLCRRI